MNFLPISHLKWWATQEINKSKTQCGQLDHTELNNNVLSNTFFCLCVCVLKIAILQPIPFGQCGLVVSLPSEGWLKLTFSKLARPKSSHHPTACYLGDVWLRNTTFNFPPLEPKSCQHTWVEGGLCECSLLGGYPCNGVVQGKRG